MSVLSSILNYAYIKKSNFTATVDPGASNDISEGYSVGSVWINTNTDEAFRCLDNTEGAAVWAKTTVEAGDLGVLASLDTVGTDEIDNDAVTYDKIQNISGTDKILGRVTSGTGSIEEIDCNALGRSLLSAASAAAIRAILSAEVIPSVNLQTGTTYQVTASDHNKLLVFNNASGVTVTLPQQSTEAVPSSFECKWINIGAGTVEWIKEGAELLYGNTIAVTGASGSLNKPATTSWSVIGGTAIVNSPAIGPVILNIATSQTNYLWVLGANATLLGIRFVCASFTAGTFKLQLNGADITGLTSLVPVAGTVTTAYCSTAQNLFPGDVISLVADGTLGAIVNMNVTPIYTETF